MEKSPEAFRTISEVAEELDVPQHVLRFWETRFAQIKPMKRGGGRRYYRPGDVDLLRGIKHLLYGEGYTIKGVQRILREDGVKYVQTIWEEGAAQPGDTDQDAAAEPEIAPAAPAPIAAVAPKPAEAEAPAVSAKPKVLKRVPFTVADEVGEGDGDRLTESAEKQLRVALDQLKACRALLTTAADLARTQ